MATLLAAQCKESGTLHFRQRTVGKLDTSRLPVPCVKTVAGTCKRTSVVSKICHATTGARSCTRAPFIACAVLNGGTNNSDTRDSQDGSLLRRGCMEYTESSNHQPHVDPAVDQASSDPFSTTAQMQRRQHGQQQQQQAQQQQEAQPPTIDRPRGLQAVKMFITQHGSGAFLSYITVSNICSVVMLSSAWVLYTRTSGMTPLGPGQWPRFLVYYAGAYAMQHLARPLKLAIGLASAPVGTAAVEGLSSVLGSSKTVALVVLLACEAVALLACIGCVVVYANGLAASIMC